MASCTGVEGLRNVQFRASEAAERDSATVARAAKEAVKPGIVNTTGVFVVAKRRKRVVTKHDWLQQQCTRIFYSST